MSEIYEYSQSIQKMIVAMLVFDKGAFAENLEVVKPEYFDNKVLASMVKILGKFYEKYERVPTWEEFLEELLVHLDSDSRLPKEEYFSVMDEVLDFGVEKKFDYIKDKVVEFAQYQEVKNTMRVGAEKHLKHRNYEAILDGVRKAMMLGENLADSGTLYYDDTEKRLEARRTGSDRRDVAIRTQLLTLDRKLGGGIAPGELGILMGPMKRGKSMTSITFAAGALMNGKSVAHFMFEGGGEFRLATMYDSKISGIPREELKEKEEIVRAKVVEFFAPGHTGRLLLKFLPAGSCSAFTIESLLRKQAIANNFKPDLVIIDYLGLMKVGNKAEVDLSDRYQKYGQITKEVLALAQKSEMAIWLLHQSTRGSYKKETVDLDDSADSLEPMRDADIILTLNQTQQERDSAPEIIRIYTAGGRVCADKWDVKLNINKALCSVYDIGENI